MTARQRSCNGRYLRRVQRRCLHRLRDQRLSETVQLRSLVCSHPHPVAKLMLGQQHCADLAIGVQPQSSAASRLLVLTTAYRGPRRARRSCCTLCWYTTPHVRWVNACEVHASTRHVLADRPHVGDVAMMITRLQKNGTTGAVLDFWDHELLPCRGIPMSRQCCIPRSARPREVAHAQDVPDRATISTFLDDGGDVMWL